MLGVSKLATRSDGILGPILPKSEWGEYSAIVDRY